MSTFGATHSYWCMPEMNECIRPHAWCSFLSLVCFGTF